MVKTLMIIENLLNPGFRKHLEIRQVQVGVVTNPKIKLIGTFLGAAVVVEDMKMSQLNLPKNPGVVAVMLLNQSKIIQKKIVIFITSFWYKINSLWENDLMTLTILEGILLLLIEFGKTFGLVTGLLVTLDLSPNGLVRSRTGVLRGVLPPLRLPIESCDPRFLWCRFKVPEFEESSVLFDFRLL